MTFDQRRENQDLDSVEEEARPRVIEGGKGLVANRIGKSFNKRPAVRWSACLVLMVPARPPASI
jgi:hypothetical protein